MDTKRIKSIAEDTLGFKFECDIEYKTVDGVYVKYDGKNAVIGSDSPSCCARAHMLLAKGISEGLESFEITQNQHFKTCGAMLDASRNGVMKLTALKKYINFMALHGFNMLMLYTEDTIELKEYPYFGYKRGRYTQEEIKEIDEYAAELGIELVPCVQTLGHLEQFLKWPASNEIKDTSNVLLCGDEKSYEFIDVLIRTMRECFTTKRIHIGMDEAFGIGTGNYLKKNGYKNHFDVLNDHLSRVREICEKYDFHPMMWSDMFYRLGSKTGDYYDFESDIPQEKIEQIPDVDLYYWDYYHDNYEMYDKLIKAHRKMNKKISFAGGIWTWTGLLPRAGYTEITMIPAMQACIDNGIEDVVATMWGDGGQETNQFFSIPQLAIFSEYCYRGKECTKEDIYSVSQFITRAKRSEFEAFKVSYSAKRNEEEDYANEFIGKMVFWSDLLIDFLHDKDYYARLKEAYDEAYSILDKADNADWEMFYDYAKDVLKINSEKCRLMCALPTAYAADDKEVLGEMAMVDIPSLAELYRQCCEKHAKLWRKTYKAFGLEVMQHKYFSAIGRLEYAADVIEEYVSGEVSSIEELDEAMRDGSEKLEGVINGTWNRIVSGCNV